MNKKNINSIFRIISLVLIQAFLVMDIALAGDIPSIISADIDETSTLAPSLRLNMEIIKTIFSFPVQQAARQQGESAVNALRLRPYEIAPQRVLIHNEGTGKALWGVIHSGKVEWRKEQAFWYGSLRVRELSGCALITIGAGDLLCVAHVFPDNDTGKISKIIQNIAARIRETAGKLSDVRVNVIFSEMTFEGLSFVKTKNYRPFAEAIGDNLEKEFGRERVSIEVQKGELREMTFDVRQRQWSFVNLNFKLLTRNISGRSKIFKSWIDDILSENYSILSPEAIEKLGRQLGIKQINRKILKAQIRAKACIRFIEGLPRDEKYNVYILRDAVGLYSAHKMLRKDSPSAVYLSKKSFRAMTGLGVKADLLMLKIIKEALSRIGKDLNQKVNQDEYEEFKNEFFRVFEEELRQNENLKRTVRKTLTYFDKEGILDHAANGFRFIDTTRKGTFPLFLEGIFSLPLRELGLWNEDFNDISTDSLMFYSNLSSAISFAAEEQSARKAESLFYPVEFNTEFDEAFSPIFRETSEADKNLFYFNTVILRNECLKKLRNIDYERRSQNPLSDFSGNLYPRTGHVSFLRKLWNTLTWQGKPWKRFFNVFLIFSALQIFGVFHPPYTQAAQPGASVEVTARFSFYENRHTRETIPGTNIVIHSHTGQEEGKHNNVLGDWAEAVINGTLRPESDIVRFDWHADGKSFLLPGQFYQWQNLKEIENRQERSRAARKLAAEIRIDSFNYPAFLTGPTGKPILNNVFWVRQSKEWQGSPKKENIVFPPGLMLVCDASLYPEAKKLARYSLNAENLSRIPDIAQLKDGFILDFDLDYFVLHREDIDWDYMDELLQSKDASSRRLAELMLKTVHFRPSREQMQRNIETILRQLADLAERGKKPAIITIAESPKFTPEDDVFWLREQLIRGLKRIYGRSVFQETAGRKEKGSLAKKAARIGMLSLVAGGGTHILFSAASSAAENMAAQAFVKSDLFRAGDNAVYVEYETGNIYRVNRNATTSLTDAQGKEQKYYSSLTRKAIYFTGLSAVVSVISTILTPGMAAAAGTGMVSAGAGIGLVIGVVLIGISLIGILGWMIRQRRKKEASTKLDKEDNIADRVNEPQIEATLSAEQVLAPETVMKILKERGEEQAARALKRYKDSPVLEMAWAYVLEFVTRSKQRIDEVKYHDEGHWNGLLSVFDALAPFMVEGGRFLSPKRIQKLARLAIYMHDTGYFDESGQNKLIAAAYEEKSKKIARKFMRELEEEFQQLDIQVVEFLIEKIKLKLFDEFKQEVDDDMRAYNLLRDLIEAKQWENPDPRDLDADFMKRYIGVHFPEAKFWQEDTAFIIMDAIWAGLIMSYAELARLDASYDNDGNVFYNYDQKVSSGHDGMGNSMDAEGRKAEDIPEVKIILDFLNRAVEADEYDNKFAEQLRQEIMDGDGFIRRGANRLLDWAAARFAEKKEAENALFIDKVVESYNGKLRQQKLNAEIIEFAI